MTLLARVVEHLTAHAIPHALIGAAALAVRGIARSTFDIDLLTTDRRVLDANLWTPLARTGGAIDCRRGDADDPLAGVVRVSEPGQRPVDLIVGRHAWQARAVSRALGTGDGPPVVTAADLILLKLYAGGTQDLWDVRELLQQPDAEAVAADVEADLATLSRSMRESWLQVHVRSSRARP